MKKIFTLIASALMTLGVNAQTTVYSWESPEGTPIEQGGTIAYVNGDGDRLNYQNSGYYTICLNGKKANLSDDTPSANAGRMVITLNEALAEGDVISITGYITKNETKEVNAYFLFAENVDAESPNYGDKENIDPAFGGSITTKTVNVPDGAAGSKSIIITRGSKAGTNLFITKLTITRAGGGGGGGETGLAEVWSASSLTFDPDTKIMQEAVKSENKGASFVIPEDANIFPTGTWETANTTGDISPVTNWLAAQSNPSLYATALREFTFTASTASVSMKAVSTPNTDSSDAEAWQNDARTNMGLNTDACKIKWDSYVKPKTGNPSLGYYDFIETTEQGTAHRVYDDLWKIGCGKAPGKGTYYEFTFAKAGSMVMGVFMNRPNQSAVVVVDKETLNPLPYTDLSFEGFCQNNTFKYPDSGAESTDPTYQKFNFREDYTIDVSAQSGRPLLGYLSFPVEAKTYLVFQPSSQVGIYGFQFTAGGDPSGVETIKTEKVWNANAPMYNLSGQQVDKSYKGIVIQNGRKFFNK